MMNWSDSLTYFPWSAKLLSKKYLVLCILLVSITTISAQQITDSSKTQVKTEQDVFVMKKSSTGAMVRSAVFPGWGQYYNESYWKIPVVWGFFGWFLYNWIDQNNLYIEYRDLYNASLSISPQGNDRYLRIREFYKDQRNTFAIYLGLTYFLTIVDSYVDAHMFDFDISEDSNSELVYNLNFRIPL